MHFYIKNQALDSLFEECAQAFVDLAPNMNKALEAHVRDQEARLKRANGMGDKGHFMILGCLPQFMYAFIRDQAFQRLEIDDVWRDQENYRRFFKIWKRCKLKTEPKKRLWLKNGRPITSPSARSSSPKTVPTPSKSV